MNMRDLIQIIEAVDERRTTLFSESATANETLAAYLLGDFYHGSARRSTNFCPSSVAYFTKDLKEARDYAVTDAEIDGGEPFVIRANLQVTKPAILDLMEMQDLHALPERVAELKNQGYDCAVGGIGIDEICVFSATSIQIQEVIAIGTEGTNESVGGTTDDTPAERFLDQVWDATYPHPFMRGQRIYGGAVIEVNKNIDNRTSGIHISDILAIEPRQGHGATALKALCDLADELGVTLDLTAKAYMTGPEAKTRMSTKQLVDWYSKFGFVKKRGNAQDGYDMVRKSPNGAEEAPTRIKLRGFKREH